MKFIILLEISLAILLVSCGRNQMSYHVAYGEAYQDSRDVANQQNEKNNGLNSRTNT